MQRVITVLIGAAAVGSGLAVVSPAAAAPGAEHIPTSVSHARIDYTDAQDASHNQHVRLHGKRAQHLVTLFDELKREPRNTVHCDAIGGPTTTVTFHGPNHTWVAKQATCTNIVVTRDGKSLRTLLPSKAWTKAVNSDLGR